MICLLAALAMGDAVVRPPLGPSAPKGRSPRSFATGKYRNLFREIGKTDAEICAKIDKAWRQLFYGDDARERVYYPVGSDTAYIKDVGNNDIRSEGMSYGMMLTVQLGQREEFDRLWKWAKTYMQYKDGPLKGYFAWQLDEKGGHRANSPASDGEEYFAMALYFAAGRWGSGEGIRNYRAEADAILHAMLSKGENNMFNLKAKQIVFVPNGAAATFTDASYQLPAFYELWARWAKENRAFWRDAAAASRRFFRSAAHPETGLFSDYSSFDGKPMKAPWDPNSKGDIFGFDAFRVASNIATDQAWFAADPWQVEQSNRLLEFFARQTPRYVSNYAVDGKPLVDFQSTGLVSMNAVAALASTSKVAPSFVKALWDAPIPSGQWRYYDGMLYLFGLLQASGQYRIWTPKPAR